MQRHVPTRTCIGCRMLFPKKQLLRIVRTPEGEVQLDLKGKVSGRGAYVCSAPCIEKAVSGKQLERALQVTLQKEDKLRLEKEIHEQVP